VDIDDFGKVAVQILGSLSITREVARAQATKSADGRKATEAARLNGQTTHGKKEEGRKEGEKQEKAKRNKMTSYRFRDLLSNW
jgi:hypothetical protein